MLLYRILVSIYFLSIRLAAFFSPKARQWVQGRRNILPYVRKEVTGGDIIWFHCASLGEFEQGRPLMEYFKTHFPDQKLLLTFFSPSGYSIQKDFAGVDYVCYLPEDRPTKVKAFLAEVRPKAAIFIKYDFWFVLLRTLRQKRIPTYFVSVVIKERHFLLRSWAAPLRKVLSGINHFFVQDDESVKLLHQMGITATTRTGDSRVDRVAEIPESRHKYPQLDQWAEGQPVFICGSTWKEDEVILKPIITYLLSKNWRIILAPHDVSSSNIHRVRELLGREGDLFSAILDGQKPVHDVVINDTIGHLNSLYHYGAICYIGGGFNPSGIHNTLEPAAYGLPIIFGPNYRKFAEARTMIQTGAAFSVRNHQELVDIIQRMELVAERKKTGQKALDYIRQNVGATTIVGDYFHKNLFK